MSEVITNHLDLWSSALLTKSTVGRGSNGKQEVYGIKKLRELILELAVRGKLVPQDSNDEPARVLLEKIAKEKARLIEEGVIRKEKSVQKIAEKEKPYKIPQSWQWVRLTDVYYSISPSGKKLKTTEIMDEGTYPVVDQGQSYIAGYTNDSELLITIPGPSVVFGDHTTEIKYVDFNFVAGADGTKILRPYKMLERYFYTYLKSYKLENRGYARHFKILNENLLALPPLAEQHSIVAKVDELMALCDELEQQQTHNIEAHQTLVETLLGTLTNTAVRAERRPRQAVEARPSLGSGRTEFEEAWTRIANHFDTLFTTEHSIDQLKQTILQLAVTGKLVPQDPNDEPASVLLERINDEKERSIDAKEIQRPKKLPAIDPQSIPFKLPEGWQWAYVWDVTKIITSGSRNWAKYYSDKGAIFVTMGNLSRGDYKLRMDSLRYVNPPADSEGSRTRLETFDLLISITGDVGNLGLVPEDFGEAYINQHTCLLRFMPDCQNRYFPELMRSPWAKFQFDAPQRGVKNSFRLSDVGEMLIPVPPLREQHRIVARVDELMALCDALQTRLAGAQTIQVNLANAIVERAVA